MIKLKLCPFCGGNPKYHYEKFHGGEFVFVWCEKCLARCGGVPMDFKYFDTPIEEECKEMAARKWNRRVTQTEINIYDKEEIYPNCTVQVLTNTVTGEVSIGWRKNE